MFSRIGSRFVMVVRTLSLFVFADKMAENLDPHLMTMLEYDWVSNTSMTHLSFLLRHALFVQQPLQTTIMERVRNYEHAAEADFRNDPDLAVLCTGSSFEGVFIPTNTPSTTEAQWSEHLDINRMYVFRKWTIGEDAQSAPGAIFSQADVKDPSLGLERSSKSTHVALANMVPTDQHGKVHVRLRVPSKELSKFARAPDNDESSMHVSGSLLRKYVEDTLDRARMVNGATTSFQKMAVDDPETQSKARSAWSEVAECPKTIFPSNVTFGFYCPVWPSMASGWETRLRRHEWPDQSDISTVVNGGCHVTFTAAPPAAGEETNAPDDLQWTLSFANAERILIHSLLTAQRKAYIILLSLYQDNLKIPCGITPHHLCHVVFWSCEHSAIGIWREDNLAECLLLLIDRLLHFLCVGILPNFFIPEMNLFKDISNEVMIDAIRCVSMVRQHPLEAHTTCYRDVRTVTGVTYEELFQPVLTYMAESAYGSDDEHPLESIVQSAFEVGHVFLTTGNKDHALMMFEEGCEIMLQIAQPDQQSLHILQLTAWLYVQAGLLEKAIEYYEMIYNIVKTGDFSDFPVQTCLSNLACLYHAKSYSSPDDVIREHLVNKAKSCFEIAVKDDFNIHTAVHYAMFLTKHNMEKAAIDLLLEAQEQNTASSDEDLWQQTSSFMEVEADTLEGDIGDEVREAGELVLPTCCLTQYLISKALVALGLGTQARDSVEALRKLHASPLNEFKDVSGSLLGYCYKVMNNFREAARMFEEVVASNKYNGTAEEQLQLCRSKCQSSSDADGDTDTL